MGVTRGQGAALRVVEEADPGTTPADPNFLLLSKETQSVKVFLDKDLKESVDIGEVDLVDLFSGKNVYGVSTEYIVYDPDLVFDFMERQSDNTPRSWSLEYIPDQDAASPVYLRGKGWRANTCEVSGELGDKYKVSLSLECGKWEDPVTADPGIGAGSRQDISEIVEDVKHFASGPIQLNGGTFATLVGKFSLKVEHQAEAAYTSGSMEPVPEGAKFGNRKVSGSADISLDEGLKEHWDRVKGFNKHVIKLPFGSTTGDREWVLNDVRFGKVEGESGKDAKLVMGSVPWQAAGRTAIEEGTVA